jgi:seryl-tRNA synthetase
MHDLAFFRANLDAISERLAARGFQLDVEKFRELDRQRRAALTESEQMQAQANESSVAIGKLKQQKNDTESLQAEVRALKDQIAARALNVAALEEEFRLQLTSIPNIPHESVPAGRTEKDNIEIHRWGQPRKFDFEPKAHWDLGPALNILDLERAAKITAARFAVYRGLGARLERALASFFLQVHTEHHGYTEVLPPCLINSDSLFGTGQLPKFKQDLFKIEGHDLWLSPTAEVQVTNLFRDETLDAEKLPIKFCAYTPCFRSEAGSYGRDVRGIIRQHQFQKVELVKFSRPSESPAELESLTADAEDILKRLGLPFRRVLLCAGDTGFSAAKTYDLEVWLPGQNDYKEISSCSNFDAFQARRANIRCKPAKGKSEYVHTLNGSGLAVGRTWVAIVENYQQADGSVTVPEVLRPYMGTDVILPE